VENVEEVKELMFCRATQRGGEQRAFTSLLVAVTTASALICQIWGTIKPGSIPEVSSSNTISYFGLLRLHKYFGVSSPTSTPHDTTMPPKKKVTDGTDAGPDNGVCFTIPSRLYLINT
jgi:hypothetical protein